MNEFTKTIVEWYEENKRELPWRESADPYLIWISEIILQQTRVAQGSTLTDSRSDFPTWRLLPGRMRTR